MQFRRLISVALVLGFHFSVCTGGFLSTATVFAADLTVSDEGGFLPDIHLCQSATPDVDTSIASDVPDPVDCEGEEQCFQNAFRLHTDKAVVIYSVSDELVASYEIQLIPEDVYVNARSVIVRDGPIYEQSRTIAHVLVKLE